jgi:hypothetical protein
VVVAYCAWWDRRGHDATCCGACPRAALPRSAASARIAPHRRTAPDWGQSADGLVEVPEAAFDIRLGSFRRDVGVGGRDEPDAHPPPPPAHREALVLVLREQQPPSLSSAVRHAPDELWRHRGRGGRRTCVDFSSL